MKQIIIFILVILSTSCHNKVSTQTNNMKHKYKFTNKLIDENSPYLIQHAHNPVNWYPWGEEALQKAKDEDKLILISIGYSACHWCHVMEHESFENEDIAKVMNDNFICIKVDREERPDIDNTYMTAVQLIAGSGGWPLNCFALPDGRPVYGGTYFRPNDWKKMLLSLSKSYKLDKNRFIKSAENIHAGIKQSEFSFKNLSNQEFIFDQYNTAINKLKSNFDYNEGGFNRAPKFPMPVFWEFLNEYVYFSKDKNIKKHLILTLDKIANGGIYDHLEGGFSRYSVDAKWKVPHFEKMLYDNAQMLSLYSNAYKQTEKKLYKKVVIETISYLENNMISEDNAFYSSYDADSEGVEGKYYVWTKKEIDSLLGKNSNLFCDYYNVKKTGNWEDGKNILHIKDVKNNLKKYNISENEIEKIINTSKQILLKERAKRIKPGLDDKSITSWNALAISGYLDAYQTFNNNKYLVQAERTAEFILNKMLTKKYSLKRSYKNKNSKINGFLDDYSFTIEAFIKLFQETGNEKYLLISKHLTDYVITHFYDNESAMFFYTSNNDKVITVRQKEVSDNVIPASNSSMANNLNILALFFLENRYSEIARKMTANIQKNTIANLNYFANWASLSMYYSKPSYELVIIGDNFTKFQKELRKKLRPDIIYAGTKNESNIPIFKDRYKKDETLIYVCKNNVCNQPVNSVKEALVLLNVK